MEREKIAVAGDEEIGFAVRRYLQELVIGRVTARCDPSSTNNPVTERPDATHELLPISDGYIGVELRPGKNVGKLPQCRLGNQQTCFRHHAIEGSCRSAARQKKAADQYVGVDNAANPDHR